LVLAERTTRERSCSVWGANRKARDSCLILADTTTRENSGSVVGTKKKARHTGLALDERTTWEGEVLCLGAIQLQFEHSSNASTYSAIRNFAVAQQIVLSH
jgi:hypothetical protein